VSQFSDRPFAEGSLIGLRAWVITYSGGLHSVYHRGFTWTPGVNVAECDLYSEDIPAVYRQGQQPHRYLGIDCECGLYGYTDGSNDYRYDDPYGPHWAGYRIGGVIEAWGLLVVGSRGFRAEKAQVKALVTPTFVDSVTLGKVRSRYPDVPWFDTQAEAVAAFPLGAERRDHAEP